MGLNTDDLKAAKTVIDSAERILIVPHANVDPDGLSSALAVYMVLRAAGKECTVICPDTPPESLEFLPGFEALSAEISESQNFVITLDCSDGVEVDKLRYTVEDHKVNIIVVPKKGMLKKEHVHVMEGEDQYDLIIVVDTAEPALLGSVYSDHTELFQNVPILNIDHHISNVQFGQINMVDPTAASATQVLYSWWQQQKEYFQYITQDIATLLLTGLITDTRSFQNPNTTPRSLEVAADLIDHGARQQQIVQHIYKTKPLSTLKIWGRALNHIQIDPSSRLVWSTISKEDMQEMQATSKETSGVLDELISTIPDADVHIVFTELEDGGLKASVRSSPAIDASKLAARLYGGGGHARAAGFSIKEFSNFQLAVTEAVGNVKKEMERQRTEEDAPSVQPAMPIVMKQEEKRVQDVPAPTPTQKKESLDIVEKLSKNPDEEPSSKKNQDSKTS